METVPQQAAGNLPPEIKEREFWAKIVADQLASGMGAESFCKRHKLNFSKYHYWKYRKIRPDCMGTATTKKSKILKPDREEKVNKFISLQISSEQPTIMQ